MGTLLSQSNDHLLNEYFRPIRDPLWGHVQLSDALLKIIQTKEFQQLSRIKQLGPSYLVYPGATHTRLNHSIGVFHIAYRMILSFIRSERRYGNTTPELQRFLKPEHVKAFFAAALLHDIGHFPYTHSLKELPLREHEELTAEILLSEPLRSIIHNDLGTDPELVASIVDDNRDKPGDVALFYRKILSAPIDPDKLDYLNRDAYFCGVPYGQQDVDYILSVIRPHPEHGVVLDSNGLAAVEGLLFSKYLMYRSVYWHPTVRIATGMIKKALFTGLSTGDILADELYGLNDDAFYLKFNSEDPGYLSLINRVYTRNFHKNILNVNFSSENTAHTALENLDNRMKREDSIRKGLEELVGEAVMPHEILLDIPERISFEIDLAVSSDSGICAYSDNPGVFTSGVVSEFTSSLRKIRLAISPELANRFEMAKIPVETIAELGENLINRI